VTKVREVNDSNLYCALLDFIVQRFIRQIILLSPCSDFYEQNNDANIIIVPAILLLL